MKNPLLFILTCVGFLSISGCMSNEVVVQQRWNGVPNRPWVGEAFWANRLQDWEIVNGKLTCRVTDERNKLRTVHLITHRLENLEEGGFVSLKIHLARLSKSGGTRAGILLGAGPDLEVLGASLMHQLPGPGAGVFVGIKEDRSLFVYDMVADSLLAQTKKNPRQTWIAENLQMEFRPQDGTYVLTIKGDMKQELSCTLPADRLKGNVAIVYDPVDQPAPLFFSDFIAAGKAWVPTHERIGPIIGTQHTLSKGTLGLTAQLMPLPEGQVKGVALARKEGDEWIPVDTVDVDRPGFTATFRVPNWPDTGDQAYEVSVVYQDLNARWKRSTYEGLVPHDPVDAEEIVVAGFTGNHNISRPGISQRAGARYAYDLDHIWYPHRDLVDKVEQHQPHVLFFSGDQVYEGASPTYPDKNHYELDYLYKWYLWHLAYRPLTRRLPVICLPDDHDVYQGNLWGAGGRNTDKDDKGGYVHPAWFVKMVERTQTSHLPAPFDPTPIDQDIGVYYTDMVYGEVGFAILEDRKFKSGCAGLPFQTRGRPDHINDPNFDMKRADVAGTNLLGQRQLDFLDHFASDWTGQYMKVALSQTIFANMATHHGGDLFRLRADLDSNGWPQTGRNKALSALRKGFVFHLAGDQHLASLVHHGIDEWDDAIWSFCVPSVANFYPRAWMPESTGENREPDMPAHLGQHRDGLGNLVNVKAVTNPTSITGVSTGVKPLELHDKMPGYGILKINKIARTYTAECWPRYADPADPSQIYPGWPRTIEQVDNYGTLQAYKIQVPEIPGKNPVLTVSKVGSDHSLYSIRLKNGQQHIPVDQPGTYEVKVMDNSSGESEGFTLEAVYAGK